MKPVHPQLGYAARRALMLACFALIACGQVACQSGPRPGEATITGGTASAQRHDDGGWALRTLPPAKEPERPATWVLILQPLPIESAPAQTPAPAPESKP